MDTSYAIVKRGFAVSVLVFLFGCATAEPYEKVTVGETREQVVAVLGAPSVPEKDFTANERKVVSGTLESMDRKGAESLSVWKRDNELFYIVGFDASGVVTVKRRFFYVAP